MYLHLVHGHKKEVSWGLTFSFPWTCFDEAFDNIFCPLLPWLLFLLMSFEEQRRQQQLLFPEEEGMDLVTASCYIMIGSQWHSSMHCAVSPLNWCLSHYYDRLGLICIVFLHLVTGKLHVLQIKISLTAFWTILTEIKSWHIWKPYTCTCCLWLHCGCDSTTVGAGF